MGLAVPAAGRGLRFGSSENKIWAIIAGKTVLHRTLTSLQEHPEIDVIVLAGSSCDLVRLREVAKEFSKIHAVVQGGATRADSVLQAVSALPSDCETVLVHDAARPFPSKNLISRIIVSVRELGSGIPGLAVSDTIKRCDADNRIQETMPREGLYRVQTPQGVRRSDVLTAYHQLGEAVSTLTDEAAVLENAGFPVFIVEGDAENIKVTMPTDIEYLEHKLSLSESGKMKLPNIRTGFGYDVHQFAEGRELWLGGVKIPHTRGLLGHSDADVMLHSVCDALLGAAALGDIGVLFPDTDQKHKDRASIEFVREVQSRLAEAGWQISNIDIALLAEEPRIMMYRSEICKVIADGLQIGQDQVNLKATTAEKMGFVGRKEGVACWAVATIVR